MSVAVLGCIGVPEFQEKVRPDIRSDKGVKVRALLAGPGPLLITGPLYSTIPRQRYRGNDAANLESG